MSINCTPGPWVPHQPNGRYMGWKVGPAWLGCAESETNNDRHLISAAPDLLEALEALVKANEEWNAAVEKIAGRPANWTDDYLNAARAAIAKAKGQS